MTANGELKYDLINPKELESLSGVQFRSSSLRGLQQNLTEYATHSKDYQYVSQATLSEPVAEWNDLILFERLGTITFEECRDIVSHTDLGIHMLHFLVSGKTICPGISSLIKRFCLGMYWSDLDSAEERIQPIWNNGLTKLAKEGRTYTPVSIPSFELIQSDLIARLDLYAVSSVQAEPGAIGLAGSGTSVSISTSRSTSYPAVLLGPSGPSPSSLDEISKLLVVYYDLIKLFRLSDGDWKSISTKFDDIKSDHGLQSAQYSEWMNKVNSTCLVRSIYVLTLIILRSRCKDPKVVETYITNGRYYNLASSLVGVDPEYIFSINPVTPGFSKGLSIIKTGSSEIRDLFCVLTGIMITRRGKSTPIYAAASIPDSQDLSQSFLDSLPKIPKGFLDLLNGGCMQQTRFKGLLIIKLLDELMIYFGDPIKTVEAFCTVSTRASALKIATFFISVMRRTIKLKSGKFAYIPAQESWKWSRNIEDNAFLDLSPKEHKTLLWRICKVYGTKNNLDLSKVSSLIGYAESNADRSAIQRILKTKIPTTDTDDEATLIDASQSIIDVDPLQ